jgi:hypothetical protein
VEKSWEGINIRELDVEGLIERFENLRAGDYKQETLNVYGRRFRRAIELFLAYLEDPSSWKPLTRKGGVKDAGRDMMIEGRGELRPPVSADKDVDASGLMNYPFPLREDCVVQLNLPKILSKKDIERLASFLNALVMEDD